MASELERKRTACKGWATHSANSLKDYLQRDDITKVKLGELISDFDKRLEALDCVQTQVEMSFEDLDALLADIEVSGNYRDSICETRLKALECFEKLSVTNPLEADVTSVTSTGTADVKLPKLSLPKFSGDVLQWQSFWDQFTAVVDSSDIPDISKFSYLRSLLEGEAKQSIQGLSLTSQHYQSARQILTDRFGRKERIIFTHIQTLLNMPVMNKCSVSNLWKLNDDLQAHTRSLEALGICGTQYGVILTPLILSRLPQDVRLEWSREGEGHESDLSYLLKFLEKEILRRERSQVFKDTVQVSSSVPEARRFKAPPTAAALQTASMNVKPSAPHECGVCGKNHPTDRCFKLLHCNGSERRERVQAYVIGACARDILPKAVHLCAQNVMVDITSCYVVSNLFQRGLLPMWNVSINMCQWRARKFPELSSRCQVWNHRPVTWLKLLVKWFLSVRAHMCCYKLPESKCEVLEGSPKPPFFLILGLIDLMLPVN